MRTNLADLSFRRSEVLLKMLCVFPVREGYNAKIKVRDLTVAKTQEEMIELAVEKIVEQGLCPMDDLYHGQKPP